MKTYCLPAIFVRYVSPQRRADHHPDKHGLHQWEQRVMVGACCSIVCVHLTIISLCIADTVHILSCTQCFQAVDSPVAFWFGLHFSNQSSIDPGVYDVQLNATWSLKHPKWVQTLRCTRGYWGLRFDFSISSEIVNFVLIVSQLRKQKQWLFQ